MPIALFNRDEMATLLILSGLDISDISPVKNLVNYIPHMSDEVIIKTAKSLYKENVAWLRKDGSFDVHLAYLMALKILLDPEDMVMYFSVKNLFRSKMFFLRRSKTTIFFRMTDDFESFILGFPLPWRYVYKWVYNELSSLVVEDGEFEREELILTTDEYIVLLALQTLLYKRLRKGRKTPRFKVIDVVKAIRNGSVSTYLTPLFHPAIDKAVFNMARDPEYIYNALDSLIDKDLLRVYADGSEVRYSDFLRKIMDPRTIEDYIVLTRARIEPEGRMFSLGVVVHSDKLFSSSIHGEDISIRVYSLSEFDNRVLKPVLR